MMNKAEFGEQRIFRGVTVELNNTSNQEGRVWMLSHSNDYWIVDAMTSEDSCDMPAWKSLEDFMQAVRFRNI